MKIKSSFFHFFIFVLCLLATCKTANADTQDSGKEVTVTTFAGSMDGFVDGKGDVARFSLPHSITIDTAGNLYVTEYDNHRIRKISPAGEVSSLAGGKAGFADGIGDAAQFHAPRGIAIDASGNLFVADGRNHRIRKITPAGEVSTLAGSTDGFADGIGSAARFRNPDGITIDAKGNLYVADHYNHRIRKVSPAGEVVTLAGGESGFADGIGSAARFYLPTDITIDAQGNLYVVDFGNNRIRKIVK
ncbi:MAG: hypothetical protein FWH56_09300 [Betaproteobacteria bacterium]|nr:hypothetical protein [Betaproteobacteria bacterium]